LDIPLQQRHKGAAVTKKIRTMSHPHQDLTRSTLSVLFIGGLITATFWVLRPFLPATIWAVTLVIATWPLMLRVQHYAGNRRGIAVLVMTLVLLLALIIPIWLSISTIVANVDEISSLVRSVLSLRMPPPPPWLAEVPVIGVRATVAWGQVSTVGARDLAPRLIPYAAPLTTWLLSAFGGLGGAFVQFLLTVAIAAVLFASGERAGTIAIRFGRRLGGDRGETAVRLAGQAIRGVALGVVVTAVAQSVLGAIGLAIAGAPFVSVLTAMMFILCLAQVGPGLVLIPAVGWMYYSGDLVWATVLLVFTIVTMLMDNFLRPMLIRRGADLPMLLILAGVIGGLIAFGLLGIFVGPTVLATTYTLLNNWMEESEIPEPPTTV
jgi:predicted PurR-regulated permease PerM